MKSDRLRTEAEIIAVLAPLASGNPGALGLGDDCALLSPRPGMDLVLKTDPVAAGVHFLDDDAPEDIAWKALAVNVSDLAAKGASPVAYVMALSFPEAPTRGWMNRFAAGLAEAQAAFGIALAGGDTDRRPGPVTVTMTVIGEVSAGRMVRRGAARAGDCIFVSGTLGDAALGLRLRNEPALAGSWKFEPADAAALIGRYLRPQPRLALAPALFEHARAAMDISDGLAKDLGRMCAASGCGADIEVARVPISAAARNAISAVPALADAVLAGGDDYEILAAIAPDNADAFSRAAAEAGVAVNAIGVMTGEKGLRISGEDGRPVSLARTGWDHF